MIRNFTFAVTVADILSVAVAKNQSSAHVLSNPELYSEEMVKAAKIHNSGNYQAYINRVRSIQKEKIRIYRNNLSLSITRLSAIQSLINQ